MIRAFGAPLLAAAVIMGFVFIVPLHAQRSSVYADVGQSNTVPTPRILQPYLDT